MVNVNENVMSDPIFFVRSFADCVTIWTQSEKTTGSV
jgi:hypothetical protein